MLAEFESLATRLRALCAGLTEITIRFAGYDRRFDDAQFRVHGGEWKWIDALEVDSLHRVWFELHEDLVATLGVARY